MPLKKPDSHRQERLQLLCANLGYEFKDLGLLNLALCHSSLGNEGLPNYERLEFLGDAVLGFLVAESLYQRTPEIPEGELTARRSLVVSRTPLAQVAADLQLSDFILVGRGLSDEALQSRRIMADLVEAVLGAIYLDGGLLAARRFVQIFVIERFADTQKVRSITDPKTRLNQWAQSHGLGVPDYAIVETTGPDHDPTFRISVTLGELAECSAEVKNKQAGEQQAAARLYKRLVELERAAQPQPVAAAAEHGAEEDGAEDWDADEDGENGAAGRPGGGAEGAEGGAEGGAGDSAGGSAGDTIQIVW